MFAGLPDDELATLATGLVDRPIPTGTLLFREGDTGGRSFFILDGEVEIVKSLGTTEERLIAVRGPGSSLGEMELFSQGHLRTASVRAKSPLQVVEMSRADLENLLRRQPALAFEIVRTLSMRLDESESQTILDLREKNRLLQQAYDELKAAQAQLIEKEKLERELEVARQIQLGILPRSLPELPGLDFGARMVPTSAVGGDLYDVIHLGNGKLGLAIGDVTGHGVPAALLMALTVTLIRVEAPRSKSPAEVLLSVNRHLIESNDSGLFVTALYGILDVTSLEFHYARAGHPLPVALDSRGNSVVLEQGTGQPLGLFEPLALDEGQLRLDRGGSMLLYTDGVTEAVDGSGEFFGTERLISTLQAAAGFQPERMCEALWQALTAYRGTMPQDDDVTLVAVGIRNGTDGHQT
jgi:serine phosphatase RsbU (regulator of sigma subunit)